MHGPIPPDHDTRPGTRAYQANGVLLINLGTPKAATAPAVRRYLAEFLSDPRLDPGVPRWLWRVILHGIILRTRPRKTAALYQKIWREDGSPLLCIARAQQQALQALFTAATTPGQPPIIVELAMRYGEPDIAGALRRLRASGAGRVLVLPLYPQYASATTATALDAVYAELRHWRWQPELRVISHYHDFPPYINALAASIRAHWQQHGQPDRLLFSFHGIPRRVWLAGDPYACLCQKTARLTAETLGLDASRWQVVFQSRFGREEWLTPYTDLTLRDLGAQGVARVDVICPGFAADCLETLEEIAHTNRTIFLQAGGQVFHYIPALNTQPAHMQALFALAQQHMQGWPGDYTN